MSSFTLYVSLLPELCVLVGRAGDPLAQARLAMTGHTEDRRRREWYWQHMSGSRTSRSWDRATVRYGSDADILLLFQTRRKEDRASIVDYALECGRDHAVLEWMASTAGTPRHIVEAHPYNFNSRATALAAAPLYYGRRLTDVYMSELNAYWDFRGGLGEPPPTTTSWIIEWAIRSENRSFLSNRRWTVGYSYSFAYYHGDGAYLNISDDFFEFLVDTGWLPLSDYTCYKWPTLGHVQVALRHGVSLTAFELNWSRHGMVCDAWLAKEQKIDIVAAWQKLDLHDTRESAWELIEVMEYHNLPWTRATLSVAFANADYAAVVWHLKQPARAVGDVKGGVYCLDNGVRLVEDLLANRWLMIDPDTEHTMFLPSIPRELTLEGCN